jgi:GTP 3',8-cyclase
VVLNDRFNRTITKMRVSVTDRCDLRCTYCMPASGLEWLPRAEILSFEEIVHLLKVATAQGITKVRLTGGEPLVRSGIATLVAMIREIPEVKDLAMTSNGIQLSHHAKTLAEAGLDRLNISLDSMDRGRFHQLTRRDAIDKVLEGIRVATEYFPGRVKINAVAIKGVTEHEYEAFARLAQDLDLIVRFIEFMPLDAEARWSADDVLSGHEVLSGMQKFAELEQEPCSDVHSPATEYRFKSGRGGVGFINSVSQPFCQSCDRVRVTAHGRLRTCLFSLLETNLLPVIRTGTAKDLGHILKQCIWEKEEGHQINKPGFERSDRPMSQIGG